MNPIDVFDPNNVNVEAQAYPRPLDLAQALGLPALVNVGAQAALPPSFSMGVADPANPEVDISTQVIQRQPVAEFLVTQEGSFRTDATATSVRYAIAAVTPIVVGATTNYKLTLGLGDVSTPALAAAAAARVNLFTLGVDLSYVEVTFINSAPALDPQDRPTAPITSYFINQIVIDAGDLASDPPIDGDLVDVPTQRVGPSDIVGLVGAAPANVLIAPAPPLAVFDTAPRNVVTDVDIDSQVLRNPIITSGQRIPLLLFQNLPIPGAFEAEFAAPVARGLPVDVFIR
jgi:hypothetical protein